MHTPGTGLNILRGRDFSSICLEPTRPPSCLGPCALLRPWLCDPFPPLAATGISLVLRTRQPWNRVRATLHGPWGPVLPTDHTEGPLRALSGVALTSLGPHQLCYSILILPTAAPTTHSPRSPRVAPCGQCPPPPWSSPVLPEQTPSCFSADPAGTSIYPLPPHLSSCVKEQNAT